MTTTNTALITGANRGIGFETARRLADKGWTVWLGARDPRAGEDAAGRLRTLLPASDVRPVTLDVTRADTVAAARDAIASATGRLDTLVNNAGISGRHVGAEDTTPADLQQVYEVNVLGPVRVTGAFLPLLRRSDDPRLVMVSSGMGSFGVTTDPERLESTIHALAYTSSKAALNMLTSQYASMLDDVRVAAVDPGYTATDFNGHSGTQSVEEGTDAIVEACVADRLPGVLFDRHGVLPW